MEVAFCECLLNILRSSSSNRLTSRSYQQERRDRLPKAQPVQVRLLRLQKANCEVVQGVSGRASIAQTTLTRVMELQRRQSQQELG